MTTSNRQRGFTVVELLIVIAVVGILAALVISSFSGMQLKAQNAKRITDIRAIAKALELYKAQTGSYPPVQTNIAGGWESSAVNPDNFLSVLRTSGVMSQVPVDPVNSAPNGAASTVNETTSYVYYRYPAGYLDCPVARGAFYILGAYRPGATKHPDSPEFSCGSYALSSWFYIIGSTTN